LVERYLGRTRDAYKEKGFEKAGPGRRNILYNAIFSIGKIILKFERIKTILQ